MRPEIVGPEQFDTLLREGAHFIDVRAEIEFARGAIPGAVNLPILTTAEREQVGTTYKRKGQEAAVALGHRLVSGSTREERIARWCAVLQEHPDALVHCWRGGLRSGLATQWIAEAGVAVRLVQGGYKALRHRLLRELEAPEPREPLYVIGGRTGSAKTDLVKALPWGVDLEELAHHRGSSFGRRVGATPAQTDFENRLALLLLRRRHAAPGAALFLEDESRMIGSISVPLDLHQAMKAAPLVIIDAPFASRVEQILRDYICEDLRERVALDPEHGFAQFGAALHESLQRIQRRLGGERYAIAEGLMRAALHRQGTRGDPSGHRAWIELLLRDYYDPMYEYQLGKSAGRVVFRGDFAAVREWCLSR
ncbi:MAG: tRNA 2-selenouridine(34) synthase MnmH [Gammaproteobacteria bacterium]|nr:tRNA 2-selenouridine(34) synthase MnmH [Gammaproteobacteria bacterium]